MAKIEAFCKVISSSVNLFISKERFIYHITKACLRCVLQMKYQDPKVCSKQFFFLFAKNAVYQFYNISFMYSSKHNIYHNKKKYCE